MKRALLIILLAAPSLFAQGTNSLTAEDVKNAKPKPAPRLADGHPDVRWLAAESLIALGDYALAPLLEELIAHADSVWVREGAAHVLSKLGEHVPNIRSVLAAMNGAAPLFEVPVAAFEALRDLRNQPPASSIPE